MGDTLAKLTAAAVQAAPVLLDRDATVAKSCRLIEEAGDHGARVIGFPEGYIPAHPYWYEFYRANDPLCTRFNDVFSLVVDRAPHGPRRGESVRSAADAEK